MGGGRTFKNGDLKGGLPVTRKDSDRPVSLLPLREVSSFFALSDAPSMMCYLSTGQGQWGHVTMN
jgi:hypothetical protein